MRIPCYISHPGPHSKNDGKALESAPGATIALRIRQVRARDLKGPLAFLSPIRAVADTLPRLILKGRRVHPGVAAVEQSKKVSDFRNSATEVAVIRPATTWPSSVRRHHWPLYATTTAKHYS